MISEQFTVSGDYEFTGSAYIGTVLYLADEYSSTVKVTTLRNNIPETTNIGAYTSTLAVSTGAGESLASTSTPVFAFNVARNTDVRTEITAPVADFATTSSSIPITGRVNDPSVTDVLVGVRLDNIEFFTDNTSRDSVSASEDAWTAEGLWHFEDNFFDDWSEAGGLAEVDGAWRFAYENQRHFCEEERCQGTLTMNNPVELDGTSALEFETWHMTDEFPEDDVKLVEIATVTKDAADNDVIGDWTALAQIVGRGFKSTVENSSYSLTENPMFGGDPTQTVYSKASGFQGVEIGAVNIDFSRDKPGPGFQNVEISLDDYVDQRVLIRFRFDTMNPYGNEGEGWFISDIKIEGEGFSGMNATVTPITPVTESGVTWYGSFAGTVTLDDGLNSVMAIATQGYEPMPSGAKLIGQSTQSGYLDLIGPNVVMGNIEPVVNVASQTLMGTVIDLNLSTLSVTHLFYTGSTTTQSKTLKNYNSMPSTACSTAPAEGYACGLFSLPVSLAEGVNVITALSYDGSGNASTSVFEIILDTEGPVLTPQNTSYPIGHISARTGEQIVFNVLVTDNVGVNAVNFYDPSGTWTPMVASSTIPVAVLNKWGVTGNYVLPMEVPNSPPGRITFPVAVQDNAGNVTTGEVYADIRAFLEAYRFYLMPGQNMISFPLKPASSYDNASGKNLVNLLGNLTSTIDSIKYYDATNSQVPQEDRWTIFDPQVPEASDLLNVETGKGYWVSMNENTTSTKIFDYDEPLAEGLPETPRPIVWSYEGRFLEPGTVPPSYEVSAGWNLIGYHSEDNIAVSTALRSLDVPLPTWASLYQYNNYINFTTGGSGGGSGSAEIVLGGFKREMTDGTMSIGKGYWLFMVQDGVLAP
jgi:hypothetical protein